MSAQDLSGKTAVVSGSTAGIGLAIARALARDGATVVVNGRTSERVERAIEAIKKETPGAAIRGVAADLGTPQGCRQFLAQEPGADILVNNLGIFEPKDFLEIKDEDWERFFQVNVLSGVRLSRAYLPQMKRNNWGRIIFISSESGIQIPLEMIHYGMTKSAQISIARGLAESCAGTGVTVNSVLPGPTASEGVTTFVERLAREQKRSPDEFEKEFFRSVRPSSLLKRFTTPEEIAEVVAFTASPRSSSITGAAIRADGGVVRAAF